MLLLDKGYFDYDYEKPERPEESATFDNTVKSDEEVENMLSLFGIGTRSKKKPETLEEIQNHIIKQESYNS